jgi:Domain of unknown function (DUF4347)/Bacterial Ig-like domain
MTFTLSGLATTRTHIDESIVVDAIAAVSLANESAAACGCQPAMQRRKAEVAFIDTALPGWKTLVAGIRSTRPDIEIELLDTAHSGLEQIAAWAAIHRGYDAIHILSHGAPGRLYFGSEAVDSPAALAGGGRALGPHGELLLYGCNLAKGDVGRRFVADLAAHSGATVAASTEFTGSPTLGGNWHLARRTGTLKTATLRIDDYAGLLNLDSVMTSPSLTVTLNRSGVDPDNSQFTAQNVVGVAGGGTAVEWLDTHGGGDTGYIEFLSATGAVTSTVLLHGAGFPQLSTGNSQLAALSNGDVVLTYSGANGSTYFSVIGPSGVAVNSTLVTSSSSAGQSTQLSNDEFAVTSVVTDAVQHTSTLNIDFYSSLSASLGQAVGTPVQISSAQLISAPSSNNIVANDSGNFAVIYNSTSDSLTHLALYANAGTSPTATISLGSALLAQAVALSDGDFAVLTSDANYANFKVQIYSASGSTVGNAVSLSGISGDIFTAADLTPGQQGFSIFSDNSDDGNVYAIRFDNAGNIVAGGTQSSQGNITSFENSGSGVEVYNGAYFLAGAAEGYSAGAVNLYLNQSISAPVLQTFELSPPTVSSVAVPADGTYGTGQHLVFTAHFSENVLVTGTPYLSLTLDTGGTVHATYAGGSGTSDLTFDYTIVSGNDDTNGIAVGSVNLNGGTIKDASTNAAVLTLNSVPSTANVLVDAIPPTVSSINTVDSSPNNLNTEHFTVTFSAPVNGIDSSDFTLVGTGTASGSIASVSGSGTTWAVTVNGVSGDGTLRLDLNNTGDAITDNFGNTLTAAHTGDQSYTIQHTPPAVAGVTVPANSTYVAAQSLDFTASFSEAVFVTGTPRIAITLDTGGTVYATYVSGSGTSTLTFSDVVAAGQQDLTGITTASVIDLNGGAIKDAAGNAASGASLNLTGEPSTAGVDVDAIVPAVSSVSVPSNGTYGIGQDLDFSVNFTKAVTVNTGGGVPYVEVTLDTGGTVAASYLSGTGTSHLVFQYVIASGELDTNGIAVGANLVLNGGAIQDAIGNSTALTLNGVASTTGVLVDSIPPTATSIHTVESSPNNLNTEHFTVTFSTDVSLHAPQINDFALHPGSVAGTIASVTPVSGNTYTVTVTGVSGDGTLGLDFITSGSTVTDAFGNAVTAAHTGDQSYTIDHTAPAATSVTAVADNGHTDVGIGHVVTITVDTGEAVTVTGTPTLSLDDGGTATYTHGSGTTALTFSYTVAAGDNIADLHVVGYNGAIHDLASNSLTAVSGDLGLQIDGTAPAAPTLALQTDTGISGTDHITSNPTLVYSALAVGDSFLYKADGGGFSGTAPTFATDHSADGIHTVSVEEVDAAGNASAVTSLTFTLDTTAPHLTGITASPGSGSVFAGSTVALTVGFNEAVNVSGGTPTLTLNDGGTAVYDAAATAVLGDASKLVFDYLVSASDPLTPSLAVTGLVAHGATVNDLAGNHADLSNVTAAFALMVNESTVPAYTIGGLTRPALELDSSGHIILDAAASSFASTYGTKALYAGMPPSTPFPPVADTHLDFHLI